MHWLRGRNLFYLIGHLFQSLRERVDNLGHAKASPGLGEVVNVLRQFDIRTSLGNESATIDLREIDHLLGLLIELERVRFSILSLTLGLEVK